MAKRVESTNPKPTHEEIAQRARAIYEASGNVPGHDLENWLAAEAELSAARRPAAEPATSSRAVARPLTNQRPAATRVF